MIEIVGFDGGNNEIKTASHRGCIRLLSNIGEYRERKLEQLHGEDDIIYEFKGKKGFAGTLAKYESEFNGSIMGTTKAHDDTLIRVLLGLWKHGGTHFNLVVGQPITGHTKDEKDKLKKMLTGAHDIVINGKKNTFTIGKVEVAAEGGAAFWSNPVKGMVRIIDIGSGTVNYASILDGRYIDKDSDTIKKGMNTNKSTDKREFVRGIATEVLTKWERSDTVFVAGGAAHDLIPYVKEFFPNANLINPFHNGSLVEPVYANAVGFYKIGRQIYEH